MNKKRILSMFLLVFTLFGVFNFITPTKVEAATNGTLSHPKTPNVYYTRRGGGKDYMSAQYEQYTMNGKVVYCIEPGVDITTTAYLGYDGLQASPYDAATNKKIELIGHYGYDYPGHQTLRYRMATQALIWETTGGQIVEFWTEQYGYGDYININAEKNEIMRLVNAHYNKPSFNGSSMEVIIGKEYKITDTNGLMSEYELYSTDNLNVRIEGNNIFVTPLATGNLTLNVDDLLQSHTARTMLANSEFIVMLNQASTDRLELAKLLNISDLQMSYITNVGAGQGLLKVGSSLVPFINRFPTNTKLYKLMTTKPGEGN